MNVKIADKSLGLGFGKDYFLARESLFPKSPDDKLYGDIIYKMVYDSNTIHDQYQAGTDHSLGQSDFQLWLSINIARYNSLMPDGKGPEFEKWYSQFKGTGVARIIGVYLNDTTIKVEKVITYIQ